MDRILVVKTGAELLAALNDNLGLNSKAGMPCPYCNEGTDRFVLLVGGHNGVEYDDEMAVRFMCRVQARTPADKRTHKPVFSVTEVLRDKGIFLELADGVSWGQIAESIPHLQGSPSRQAKPSPKMRAVSLDVIADDYMAGLETWKSISVFSDVTLRRFHLGVAVWPNGFDRATIPIPLPIEWTGEQMYVRKGRKIDPRDPLERKYDMPAGVPPVLFDMWFDKAGELSRTPDICAIGEGEKSTIALWEMGFSPVACTTGGAGTWLDEWSLSIIDRGVRGIVIIGDDDDAGDTYAYRVYRSFLRVLHSLGRDLSEFSIQVARWEQFGVVTDRSKRDPYDILADSGVDSGKAAIMAMLCSADNLFNPRPDYVQAPLGDVTTVNALRGDGEDGLYPQLLSFVRNYRKLYYTRQDEIHNIAESGTLHLERTAPGVGKTRAAVRLAETIGLEVEEAAKKTDRKRDQVREAARQQLLRGDLDDKTRTKLERQADIRDAPRNGVMYIAPFLASWDDVVRVREHPELWFNFEARTPDNCEYYETQAAVAARGYTVMGRLCHNDCPFAEKCRRTQGQYMQQFDEMRKYPIVFLRHPHLLMKDLVSHTRLVIVDEDPHAEYLRPCTLQIDDLDTSVRLREWLEDRFDPQQVSYVLALAEALEKSLVSARHDSAETLRSGPHVLRLVDLQLRSTLYGVFDLLDVARNIDPEVMECLDKRTPRELLDPTTVQLAPSGHFPRLIRTVLEEAQQHYAELLQDIDYRWNSRINIVQYGGKPAFVFFDTQQFPIPLRVPVVALDATGSVVKYQRSFGRDIQDHKSSVRHEDTKTVVFTGSGFSISSMRTDKQRSALVAVTDGEVAAFNDAVKVLCEVAPLHASMLVVTFKAIEEDLKQAVMKLLPWEVYSRLRFAHFQALRGSNVFEDLEAVLLIGTPRPPLRETQMMLSALFYHDQDPLDLAYGQVWQPYHADGALPPARVKTFADSRAQPLIDELEAGEMLQCLSRIRPHTSTNGKTVYLLTERPAAEWVTHLVPYRSVTAQYDLKALRDLAIRNEATATAIGVRKALNKVGVDAGERRIRAISAMLKGKVLTSWIREAILPIKKG